MMLRSVIWNLFLAAIPVPLGYLTAWCLGWPGGRRRLPLFLCLLMAVVWILFLPNSCYLLTEWRHLLFDSRWSELLRSGRQDRHAMLETAYWAFLFLGYSTVGMLLFCLGIRPMEQWWRTVGRTWLLAAPPLFFLISLGVYLGLVLRHNSWDVLAHPLVLVRDGQEALASPTLLGAIGCFGLFLWIVYEAIDLWVDGVTSRLRAWLPASSGAAAGRKGKGKAAARAGR